MHFRFAFNGGSKITAIMEFFIWSFTSITVDFARNYCVPLKYIFINKSAQAHRVEWREKRKKSYENILIPTIDILSKKTFHIHCHIFPDSGAQLFTYRSYTFAFHLRRVNMVLWSSLSIFCCCCCFRI